ncbi:MAG: molybdate ABC transporter substrate-binding protein [Proteobacteria bacterium]|nr:molybdate ABC transporter substrate-binding protein [Pseudomonadota bacterium]
MSAIRSHRHPLARRTLAAIAWLLAATGTPIATCARAADDVPNIAAAADLKFALEQVIARFRQDTSSDVRLAFGSSGNFVQQIAQGAPFQMFLSADESFVFSLSDQGRTVDRGTLYAVGRIVLFAARGSSLQVDPDLNGLRAALAAGAIRHFAIANPEHAPYGRAAEQALRRLNLWETIRPRLVLGENVSQAAQFAATGSAEGGIIAYSLALAPELVKLGRFALIPGDWHAPLRQRMVLIRGAGETARAFYRYVQSPAARDILRRNGFVHPDES